MDDEKLGIIRAAENYHNEFRYYSAEIFDEAYLDIYGNWKLFAVSGGIHGQGHELNFDHLEILRIGMYRFEKDGTTLESGKILVEEQSSENLRISLEPDPGTQVFMYDSEKYVILDGPDTLHLNAPCCDRYNYHFRRVNKSF
jgi:hypothetical protein